MKVLAFLLISVALLQTSFQAEASSYETSFPQEDFAEAYPMETPDQDNRVLVEEDDNSADEIVSERSDWNGVDGEGQRLERLMEKWSNKPANLAQHPPTHNYGSGAPAPAPHLHPDAYSSGHHHPFQSGTAPAPAPAPAPAHHAPAPAPLPTDHVMHANEAAAHHAAAQEAAAQDAAAHLQAIVSEVSFTLNMPITVEQFKLKKAAIIQSMARKLFLPVSEVQAWFEMPTAQADMDDVLLEEGMTATAGVKFEVKHKSKDANAAKARQAKIEAEAKSVASGGKTLDGIAVPKQTPKMKVSQTNAPLKKSGVSSNSMPSFAALVVVGLTSLWYL